MCLCSIDYCDFAANKFIPCISGEVLPNFSEFNIMQCNSGLIIILKMIQDLILVRKHYNGRNICVVDAKLAEAGMLA
jgi:hypothetical protein